MQKNSKMTIFLNFSAISRGEIYMLTWNESLKLGIDTIDTQHREIFDAINKLMASFDEGKEKESVYEVLEFIEAYVHKHFSTEEFYLKKYNYPEADLHIKMHKAFSDKLTEYKTHYKRTGLTRLAALEMNNILIQWWNNHISKTDFKYISHISGKIKAEV